MSVLYLDCRIVVRIVFKPYLFNRRHIAWISIKIVHINTALPFTLSCLATLRMGRKGTGKQLQVVHCYVTALGPYVKATILGKLKTEFFPRN